MGKDQALDLSEEQMLIILLIVQVMRLRKGERVQLRLQVEIALREKVNNKEQVFQVRVGRGITVRTQTFFRVSFNRSNL